MQREYSLFGATDKHGKTAELSVSCCASESTIRGLMVQMAEGDVQKEECGLAF